MAIELLHKEPTIRETNNLTKIKNTIVEFGDFQTPTGLSHKALSLLAKLGVRPCSILEPTCGIGGFILSAASIFQEAETIVGFEINQAHLNTAKSNSETLCDKRIHLFQGDFFKVEWSSIISEQKEPLLITGNPPWVTTSSLGSIQSNNAPKRKSNSTLSGLDALTGKSNFDISEWMVREYLRWSEGKNTCIAILCKTSVARKILHYAWSKKYQIKSAKIFKINAQKYFNVSVESCFFVIEIDTISESCSKCEIFDSLDLNANRNCIEYKEGHLISDSKLFETHKSLFGVDSNYQWRSGIKHDCSKIMELTVTPQGYRNKINDKILKLEEEFLFPMLKSSDIGNNRINFKKAMIVPQRYVGENTMVLASKAPCLWNYLNEHATLLNKRASSIYKNKPEFSIFGVGDYSFSPWKIAISGFYKKLEFIKIGLINEKPVVFDDTVYFLPCWSESEASFLLEILNSEPSLNFLQSMIQWDEKRPITIDLLKRLNIHNLAKWLNREKDYLNFCGSSKTQIMSDEYIII